MSTPFLGEIRIISFNYAPKGWAFCNGQLLPINQNQALFALLGTTYGGNGQTTFALPNLRDRVPLHAGNGHVLGEAGGEEAHTLTQNELAAHTHLPQAAPGPANQGQAINNTWTTQAGAYTTAAPDVTMHPSTITFTGGSQPHSNLQPSLVLNYIIALQGIFPSHP
jgi:microcystin-dependent protein